MKNKVGQAPESPATPQEAAYELGKSEFQQIISNNRRMEDDWADNEDWSDSDWGSDE